MEIEKFFEEKGIRQPNYKAVRLVNEDGEHIELTELFNEFAKINCQQQRENCFSVMKHSKFGNYTAKKEAILNAPSPLFTINS